MPRAGLLLAAFRRPEEGFRDTIPYLCLSHFEGRRCRARVFVRFVWIGVWPIMPGFQDPDPRFRFFYFSLAILKPVSSVFVLKKHLFYRQKKIPASKKNAGIPYLIPIFAFSCETLYFPRASITTITGRSSGFSSMFRRPSRSKLSNSGAICREWFPFRSCRIKERARVTAAGPLPIFTGFPIKSFWTPAIFTVQSANDLVTSTIFECQGKKEKTMMSTAPDQALCASRRISSASRTTSSPGTSTGLNASCPSAMSPLQPAHTELSAVAFSRSASRIPRGPVFLL